MQKQNKTNKEPKIIKPNKPLKKRKGQSFFSQFATTILIFAVLLVLYSAVVDSLSQPKLISLSQLASDIKTEQVKQITVFGDELEVEYFKSKNDINAATSSTTTVTTTEGLVLTKTLQKVRGLLGRATTTKTDAKKEPKNIVKKSKKEAESSLTETLVNYGVEPRELTKVTVIINEPTGLRFWFMTLVPIVLPILLIFFIIMYISRQMKGGGGGGGGMQAFTFGQSRARMIDPSDKTNRVTFKDVAGAKEAKEELEEIVDFLKSPKKFLAIGAKIPKGVMLMGQPGTGKTLLARAVAGEAGVPFFTISGSEFVEMFVGVGASRVRDLFKTAKKAAPAIIFVDEIDAVGRVRGSGVGGGNDEREQTLNQILVEMDGFEPNEKVIVMAATNRPDVLDPALLRPGRFDRRVTIDLPDREARLGILQIHARKKPLHADTDLDVIAERTPGFSGADLANLMNEAAILAARETRKEVTQYDLIRSIEKVMLGPERKSHVLSKKEKEITAYHEMGHALVASVLKNADPVHKVSIISRGRAAGYTLKLPFDDKRMQTKAQFIDDIAVSLGGYLVEKAVFKDVSTGPSNDLQVLTNLARNMVTRWGMSDKIGTIALEGDGGAMFGDGVQRKEHSEKLTAEIDAEVRAIIATARKKAETVLRKHNKALHGMSKVLIEKETLERDEFEDLLREYGIAVKKKEDYTG